MTVFDTTTRPAPGPASSPLLEAALSYVQRGWAVCPLFAPNEQGACDCNKTVNGKAPDDPEHPIGKHPRTRNGLLNATTKEKAVRNWWGLLFPGANVAILTGSVSGLVVLDVDSRHGGGETLAELERANGPLPSTISAITGSGGQHYYFEHPGVDVRNSAGKLGAGLDIRGDGGYVVAPPSLHASGRRYEWEAYGDPADVPLAAVPPWLLKMLVEPERRNGQTIGEVIPEGQRNGTLASIAGSLRRRGSSEAVIYAALEAENQERCHPPLSEDEVRKIAGSVANEMLRKGLLPIVLLVAVDGRVSRFRHPLPTNAKLTRCAEIVVCGRRKGLVSAATRLVHFGPLSEDLAKRHRAVMTVDAAAILGSRPGRPVRDIFEDMRSTYARTGYGEEWQLHHQGGLISYQAREYVASPADTHVVALNQAFAWNPSITGTKSEDTIVVTEYGPEVLTTSPDWPEHEIVIDGRGIPRPDFLVH